MAEIYVDARLAAAPGGLPAMVELWARHHAGEALVEPHPDRWILPLPGPQGLVAAGLLVRLAESCGLPMMHGEVPSWDPEYEGDGWILSTEGGDRRMLAPWAARDGRMAALRRFVHHIGRLYEVARAKGLEPVVGEWPEWTRMGDETGHDVWMLHCGEDQAHPFHSAPLSCAIRAMFGHASELVTVVPVLAGITDPYEALKLVHAEVCGE